MYFLSRRHFARNFTLFSSIVVLSYTLMRVMSHDRLTGVFHDGLIAPYLPWFLVGVGAHAWWQGRTSRGGYILGLAMAQMALLEIADATGASLFVAVAISSMFLGCIAAQKFRAVFSGKILVRVGVASYSLYLLHQCIGVTITANVAASLSLDGFWSLWIPMFVAVVMVGCSGLIFFYWEGPLNRWIIKRYGMMLSRKSF